MCFMLAVSSVFLTVPAPPEKITALSQLCEDRKEGEKQSASSALNQNNYPKKCSAEPARGEGNEAQRLLASASSPVIISHLSAALEADWEEALCSRQTDREKA